MHAVIFDIDGTLLESAAVDDDLYRQAVLDVLGDVVLRPSLHDYDFVSDSGILTQVFEDNGITKGPRDDVRAAFVRLIQQHIDTNGPFRQLPGAAAILEYLRASEEHALAIATGGWRATAELKLRSAGIFHEDIPLATSSDAQARTDIMQVALRQLGSEFDSITYYGDGPWDRDACAALGWEFVAVGPELGGLTSYSVEAF